MNRPDLHPAWCAQGHRCHLGEHRARPVTIHTPGAGSAVLTRVRNANGVQHAEIRLSVSLPADEPAARQRLVELVWELHALLCPPGITDRPHRRDTA
jgi:hypothetical protein